VLPEYGVGRSVSKLMGESLMSNIRISTGYFLGAALSMGVAGFASIASAADIPVKAVPKATPWVLDVHGGADITFANTRVTGGGLYLYRTGYLTQMQVGLSLDIYKNPVGLINSFSVMGGVWNELWSKPPVGSRAWQEMDWWLGFNVGFAKYWNFTAQYLEFDFPSGGSAKNYDFKLALDDGFVGWPIKLNPYVELFYNGSGGSTVVFGKTSGSYRVSLGIGPSYSFLKSTGVPLSISVPTWVTVGPSTFWNRQDGTTNFCGPLSNAACSSGSTGYWSTGLQAKLGLESIIPKRLGSWYVKGGVQYYHIVNDTLLAAQGAAIPGQPVPFPDAKRDIFVASGGIGFSF
jgi:hypothetical protein